MSENLYISEDDLVKLKALAKFKPHALMLEFYHGADANKIIDQLIEILKSKNQLNLIELRPEDGKQKIAISAVRDLKKQTRTNSSKNQLNLIVIEDASSLSSEAATALLKILEEPTSGTMFILGVRDSVKVLPTIASRSYKFKLKKPSHNHVARHLKIEDAKLKSLMMLSGGRLEVLEKLVSDIETGGSSTKEILEDAKKWVITKDKLERLETIHKYSELNLMSDFMASASGVHKSLIDHMISKGDLKSAQILGEKAKELDGIIKDTAGLNLNKRVVQIKLNNI
jgi:DNA polymerase III delta prime subunit